MNAVADSVGSSQVSQLPGVEQRYLVQKSCASWAGSGIAKKNRSSTLWPAANGVCWPSFRFASLVKSRIAHSHAPDFRPVRWMCRVDAGHQCAEVPVWLLLYTQRRDVAWIVRNVLGLRWSEPSVVRRLTLEVTRRPDAVWKMIGPRLLRHRRSALP